MRLASESEKTGLLSSHSAGASDYTDSNSLPMSMKYDELLQEDAADIDAKTHHSSFLPWKRTAKGACEPLTLCWDSVCVRARPAPKGCLPCGRRPQSTGPKQILDNVSGIAKSGEMVVIMGASGSGKTTLLNTLTSRNAGDLEVTGDIRVNGKNYGEDIANVSAYIQQHDLMVGTLTVREHLLFASHLRMEDSLNTEQRCSRVAEVMLEMGLTKCADVVIGMPGMRKGISGGEKKRLAFATALLTKPSILFCDEPTTGLDSFMAQSVVQALQKLAERGHTILCIVHQPSSQLYATFDRLLLMAEGRTAYLGAANKANNFFGDIGFECPVTYNPADYFIQTLAVVPGKEAESKRKIQFICDEFSNSSAMRQIKWDLNNTRPSSDVIEQMDVSEKKYTSLNMDTDGNKLEEEKYKASWLKQFYWCLWRSFLDLRRDKRLLPTRIGQLALSAFTLGLLYWQQKYDQNGVSNFNSSLFLLTIQITFSTAFTVATAFAMMFPIFLREHKDRMYSASSYYVAKVLADLPAIVIGSFLYATIAYWMIGFDPNVEKYFIFVAALMTLCIVSGSVGHLGGALLPNPQFVLIFLPFVLGLLLMFSGFLLKDSTVMPLFLPVQAISPYRYAYEALLINQWDGVGHLGCSNGTASCYRNGWTVIRSFNYDATELPYDFLWNILIVVGLQIIGMFALYRKTKK